jgi:hypothetical protein
LVIAEPDANLKISKEVVLSLKKLNHKLLDIGFDNIKVLNSIAVDELVRIEKSMTKEEFQDWVSDRTSSLQKRGIVKKNARSIGHQK